MALQTQSLPQGRLDTIITGIQQEEEAFADELCRTLTPEDTDGKMPLFGTGAVMRKSQASERRQLSEGAQGDEIDVSSSNVSFAAGRYGTWMPVSKKSIIRMDSMNESAIERAFTELIKQANIDIDADLSSLLTDTNVNESFAAANAWSDDTNGTPVDDIESAYDKVPGATDLVLGKSDLRDLKDHPNIDPASDNYDRTHTDAEGVRAFLLNQFEDEGLERVWFFTKKERTNNPGQSVTKGFIHENNPWLGYRENLLLFDPDHEENPDRGEDIEGPKSSHRLWYYRFADLRRHATDTGCVITGT